MDISNQKQRPWVFLKKFNKFYRKAPVTDPLFNKVAVLTPNLKNECF